MTEILGYGPLKAIQWEPPIVIVGEQNPYGFDPRYALYDEPLGASGHRLRTLVFGVKRTTYARFHRMNLCDGCWTTRNAEDKAKRVCGAFPTATLILCGKKVQSVFNFTHERGPFTTWEEAGLRFVLLPHPSGRNHLWSEPGSFERARTLLREVRPDVPWGEELP